MNEQTFYIGIDGGGTNCRARLEDASGTLLAVGNSGSANVMRSVSTAQMSMIEACEQAINAAPVKCALNQVVVGAGLAGANVPSALASIENWAHPFAKLSVLSDLHGACLGAHGGADGAVIIAGTGSSGTRFLNGKFSDVGGHGFIVGDVASGAWLGLSAVQHALQVLDGIYPLDDLTQAVCEHLSVSIPLDLVQVVSGFKAKDYAAIAPIVVALQQQGEANAQMLFARAVDYLEKLATQLVANTHIPLCLIGGLSAIYQPHFSPRVQEHIVSCKHNPEQGAIYYVKQLTTQE